jgi:hypothetical protein
MPDELSDSLMPSNEQISELLKQMAQYAPMEIPGIVFQLFCARMLSKEISKLKDKLDRQIEELSKKLGQ